MKKLARTVSNILCMAGLVFRHIPLYGVLFIAVNLAFNVFYNVFVNYYMISSFVNMLVAGESFAFIARMIAVYAAVMVALMIFNAWFWNVYSPKMRELYSLRLGAVLYKKAVEIEFARYDDPEFYNEFIWATSEAGSRSYDVLTQLSNMIGSFVTAGALFGILLTLDPLLIVICSLSFLVGFLTDFRRNKLQFRFDEERRPLERRRDYSKRVFYLREYAKELRVSDVSKLLLDSFEQSVTEAKAMCSRYGKQLMGLDIASKSGSQLLGSLAPMLYAVYKILVEKSIGIGGFVGVLNASGGFTNNLGNLAGTLPELQKQSLYIEKFRTFYDYVPAMRESKLPLPADPAALAFENVGFTYPGAEEPVVKNVSFRIRPGEKVALVGHNGAGKTTLVKLAMRLYDVTEGRITFGGVDIRDFPIAQYRAVFGAVFQDFQLFAGSLAENVKMDVVAEADRPGIEAALAASDFTEKLASLEKGLETSLTREFENEGTIFSGGESQKVAIARVFARPCRVAILDEPSASLDPVSEYNINNSMFAAAGDKSVLFISHRLSTTRMADRIIMLEGGVIVEEGTHGELMDLRGMYAEMFNLQAEKYR